VTTGCSWKACCGSCSPWRDLPEVFGDWNSVFRRFSRWRVKGVWCRIFETMSDDPDFEYLIVDSTIVRAHQHAAGAKKGGSEDQALGRSRGGLSTKIHMAVRGLGCPARFRLTAGQKGDAPQAAALIEGLAAPSAAWDRDLHPARRRQTSSSARYRAESAFAHWTRSVRFHVSPAFPAGPLESTR
jgi:transposase